MGAKTAERDPDTSLELAVRLGERQWLLHPGQCHPALDDWLTSHYPGIDRWICLSGINPGGRPLSLLENHIRIERLAYQLAFEAPAFYPSLIRHRGDEDGGDAAFFVLGMDAARGRRLGREWGQPWIIVGIVAEAAKRLACDAAPLH